MKELISVTILTKNSQIYIKEVLEALCDFDEVLLCDTGSKDATLLIAKEFPNVKIVEHTFIGFGPTHNLATNLAKNNWILSVDSDEVLTSELNAEIQAQQLDNQCVYSIPRRNEYRGKWIKWCGWYPDRQNRLYNRQVTRFTDAQVHETVIVDNLRVINLMGAIKHYSYRNVADFLEKMQNYSTLFAKQNQGEKSSSLCKAVLHGLFSFFKSYILKRGILGGREGFEISLYNANTAFYKYMKLAEANEQLEKTQYENFLN